MLALLQKQKEKLLKDVKYTGTKTRAEKSFNKLIIGVEEMINVLTYQRPKSEQGFTFDYTTLKEYSSALGGRADLNQQNQIVDDRFVKKTT